jgi:solute carrier family 25 oxoglutarate transporter 11
MRTINGIPEYKGILDVWVSAIRKEGFTSLWKGFLPYYLRVGPHTVLCFVFLEQLRSLYKKYFF